MASRALKDFNAGRGGKEPPDVKRLAIDYPAYSMVTCQVIDKLKLVLLFAAQYLTWRSMTVKMTVIFVSYV